MVDAGQVLGETAQLFDVQNTAFGIFLADMYNGTASPAVCTVL